jgi:hypothetical protein
MPDLEEAFDEQDQSEVFDEDNTNDMDRGPGEEAEQFEDLVDVMDVTTAVGDDDDDDGLIGEEMEDEDIVSVASDEDDDEGLRGFDAEQDAAEGDAADDPDEVELVYMGDLDERGGAASAGQALESDSLSDEDLRELDYKDEFTIDEDDGASPRGRASPLPEGATMNARPDEGLPEDRTHVGGGVRGDDDKAADRITGNPNTKKHQEELLDEGVEETFPASDPVSVKRIT